MTATDLNSLIEAADLTDLDDCRMLADAFEEAGRDEEARLLRLESVPVTWHKDKIHRVVTALEFANSLEYPVVWYSGHANPASDAIAILDSAIELPFDLNEVEGVVEGGGFVPINLYRGNGAYDNNFSAFGGQVWNIEIYDDEEEWLSQEADYNAEYGDHDDEDEDEGEEEDGEEDGEE